MINKFGKGILIAVLTTGVLLGAYLGFVRNINELQDRTVELCVDLNDIKKIAAFEKKPLGPILDEMKKTGIVSIGLFEETLPDANASGELYYAKGSGILRMKDLNLAFNELSNSDIKNNFTYIYAPSDDVRKRVRDQLEYVLGGKSIRFIEKNIFEINVAEEDIRELGLGISEMQRKFISNKGFDIIPRVWNDTRFHSRNIEPKIAALSDYQKIIFDGEEIPGYPEEIKALASSLKKHDLKYGYIEIVKQDGDGELRKLMGNDVIRVHSVPKEELKKLKREEVVNRFVRAARERKVRLIYMRPFLPPQIDANPVTYNLNFFQNVKTSLENAGFIIGRAEISPPLRVKGWQITLLGTGVMIGSLFLINNFIRLPMFLMYLLLILSAFGIVHAGSLGYTTQLQKGLALLAAITFPSLAVISTLSKMKKAKNLFMDSIFMALNIISETMVGVFLLVGLLADYRFMLGVETFSGVKIALIFPVLLVVLYFILNQGQGSLKQRVKAFLSTKVSLAAVSGGLLVLAALGIFIARSGNFTLPVPAFEKIFRNFLETVLYIRPRTKEFMVGYPLLFIAAVFIFRENRKWVWLSAAIGAIAPISVFNSFSHIHTPIMVSMVRTVNGLVLGTIIGLIVAYILDRILTRYRKIS
jgi:hypothetical protein